MDGRFCGGIMEDVGSEDFVRSTGSSANYDSVLRVRLWSDPDTESMVAELEAVV